MPSHSKKQDHPGPDNLSDFHDIQLNAPIGVFTSTPDSRNISVNHATAEMLGYDNPQELISSITDIASQVYVNPEDRKEFIRLIEKHGELQNYECRFRRRDGSAFWVSRNVRALKDENGHIVAYQGFNTNISERKRTEEAIAESEKKFHSLFDSMTELVVLHEVIFDEHGEVVNCKVSDCNPAFTETTGIKREDVVGKMATDAYGTEAAPYPLLVGQDFVQK